MVRDPIMNRREKAWIVRNARVYLDHATEFGEVWSRYDIFEIALDQVACDLKDAENEENYELCAKLKKTFEYIENLK